MTRIDFNCFIGGWPFHKVRNKSYEALRELHKENGITEAYVSSTDAIFFNDPYEAEVDLAATIQGSSYNHVMTVNPMLPGFANDIRRAVCDLHIKGIRILPGFHGYTLDCDEMKRLSELLLEYRLPLFLTLRMEDERVTYMFHPKSISMQEVRAFLKINTGIPILLCNIWLSEIFELKDTILTRQDLFADFSGLKDELFAIEMLDAEHLTERLVYGSLAPISCLKSSMLLAEMSKISAETRERILTGSEFQAAIQSFNKKKLASV